MFCRKCGKEIEENAKFCVYCGTEIVSSVREANNNVASKESLQNNEEKVAEEPGNNQASYDVPDDLKTEEPGKTKKEKKKKEKSKKGGIIKTLIAAIVMVLIVFIGVNIFMPDPRTKNIVRIYAWAMEHRNTKVMMSIEDLRAEYAVYQAYYYDKWDEFDDLYDELDEDELDEAKEKQEESYDDLWDTFDEADEVKIKIVSMGDVKKVEDIKGLYKVKVKLNLYAEKDDEEFDEDVTAYYYVYKGKFAGSFDE